MVNKVIAVGHTLDTYKKGILLPKDSPGTVRGYWPYFDSGSHSDHPTMNIPGPFYMGTTLEFSTPGSEIWFQTMCYFIGSTPDPLVPFREDRFITFYNENNTPIFWLTGHYDDKVIRVHNQSTSAISSIPFDFSPSSPPYDNKFFKLTISITSSSSTVYINDVAIDQGTVFPGMIGSATKIVFGDTNHHNYMQSFYDWVIVSDSEMFDARPVTVTGRDYSEYRDDFIRPYAYVPYEPMYEMSRVDNVMAESNGSQGMMYDTNNETDGEIVYGQMNTVLAGAGSSTDMDVFLYEAEWEEIKNEVQVQLTDHPASEADAYQVKLSKPENLQKPTAGNEYGIIVKQTQ